MRDPRTVFHLSAWTCDAATAVRKRVAGACRGTNKDAPHRHLGRTAETGRRTNVMSVCTPSFANEPRDAFRVRDMQRAKLEAMCLADEAAPVDMSDSVSGFRFVHTNHRHGDVYVPSSLTLPANDDEAPGAVAKVVVTYVDENGDGLLNPNESGLVAIECVSAPKGRPRKWIWSERLNRKVASRALNYLLGARTT